MARTRQKRTFSVSAIRHAISTLRIRHSRVYDPHNHGFTTTLATTPELTQAVQALLWREESHPVPDAHIARVPHVTLTVTTDRSHQWKTGARRALPAEMTAAMCAWLVGSDDPTVERVLTATANRMHLTARACSVTVPGPLSLPPSRTSLMLMQAIVSRTYRQNILELSYTSTEMDAWAAEQGDAASAVVEALQAMQARQESMGLYDMLGVQLEKFLQYAGHVSAAKTLWPNVGLMLGAEYDAPPLRVPKRSPGYVRLCEQMSLDEWRRFTDHWDQLLVEAKLLTLNM